MYFLLLLLLICQNGVVVHHNRALKRGVLVCNQYFSNYLQLFLLV